jgi:hypothetical protein
MSTLTCEDVFFQKLQKVASIDAVIQEGGIGNRPNRCSVAKYAKASTFCHPPSDPMKREVLMHTQEQLDKGGTSGHLLPWRAIIGMFVRYDDGHVEAGMQTDDDEWSWSEGEFCC